MTNDEPNAETRESWEKFLNPQALRASLVTVSVFLAAYEMLKQALVERLRDFFAVEWTADGVRVSDDYKEKVLARHDMPYFASAQWFQEMGALESADIEALRAIRKHRNFVAHNVPMILMDANTRVDATIFREIHRLVTQLDRWWIQEIELTTNPEFTAEDIAGFDVESAKSMRMMTLDLLANFADGHVDHVEEIYAAFREIWKRDPGSDDPQTGQRAGGVES